MLEPAAMLIFRLLVSQMLPLPLVAMVLVAFGRLILALE
jgi:hypothetical protein